MSERVDDILDVIDAGLQHSWESGCGTDYRPDQCARCRRNPPAQDGDLCARCRSFLLEDSDEDPALQVGAPVQATVMTRRVTVRVWADTEEYVAAVQALMEQLTADVTAARLDTDQADRVLTEALQRTPLRGNLSCP